MSLESVTEQIRQKLSFGSGISAKVKFDFGDEGRIFIDATQTPPVITHDDGDADTTLLCALTTFEGFLNGTADPNVAFLMGKLKVQGSMGLAMKLNAFLES